MLTYTKKDVIIETTIGVQWGQLYIKGVFICIKKHGN